MHVAHIVSNFRWTECSEPAVDLALAQRELGGTVTFVCGKNLRMPEDSIEYQAPRKGLEPVIFEMTKHFRLRPALRDICRLRNLISERGIDVFHCHMSNAHLLVSLAVQKRPNRPLVIRHCYNPEGLENNLRLKLFCLRNTDGVIAVSSNARIRITKRLQWPSEKVAVIEPGIDVARFADRHDIPARESFGLSKDHFVVGMVTAVGRRRRIDIVLEAIQRIASRFPYLRFLLVGRGKIEDIVKKPAKNLGIEDRLILAGYCRDDRLVSAYRAMDVLAYTMPGTDKSCRTVREAMASGVPVVASRVGFLTELIDDGVTGRLTDPTPEGFAKALAALAENRKLCEQMSFSVRETAKIRFSRRLQAERTLAFYEQLIS